MTMKTRRLCCLVGAAFLVAGALGGCLQFEPTAPQALFTASTAEHLIPFTASFDATLSQRTPDETLSYVWTFGDGSAGSGPLVDHAYSQDGTYEVLLTVYDTHGASSSSHLAIRALNPLPTATFSYSPKSMMEDDYIVSCSEWVTFDASSSADDGEVTAYEWNFGDGQYAEGAVVKHRWMWKGFYNVALVVTDNDGGKTTVVQQIQVEGGPPCNADVDNGGTCQ
jgi:PKD repeat protein